MIFDRSITGLCWFAMRRVKTRLSTRSSRTWACLLGVAGAIVVLVVVTGIALGLATMATVQADGVNYWLAPEEDDIGTTPFAVESPELSDSHSISAEIERDDRVDYVTPVAFQPIRLEHTETGESAYLLAMGVIPDESNRTVLDINIGSFNTSYSYYNDGGYDGTWTGELIASPGAASQLDVAESEKILAPESGKSFKITEISDTDPVLGPGDVPVVVTHLAELQQITGTTESDQSDQILVATDDTSVEETLKQQYPNTSVTTGTGVSELTTEDTDLPLALAVASGIVALGIGVLFVTTMMGLEITAARKELATMHAVGLSRSSVLLVVLTETITIAILGGVLGLGIGAAAITVLNTGVAAEFGLPAVAALDPFLAVYALGVSLFVGVLAVLYPLYLAVRTNTLKELTQ